MATPLRIDALGAPCAPCAERAAPKRAAPRKGVLVLRAREDAERTAEKLRAMGFAPLVSPVLEIVATGAEAPPGEFDAAIATSAKGVEHCAFSLALPLHAVGARACALAAARGFAGGLVASSASLLASAICAQYRAPARFLYLGGRDRKDQLEARLRRARHCVVAVETYEARAAAALAPEAAREISSGGIDFALHYSRRSAEIFGRLVKRAGLAKALGKTAHLALSQDVATQLRRELGVKAHVAASADEDGLLALLAAQVAP